eukprot:364818-Chlamydomonas_euryale.AAC.30
MAANVSREMPISGGGTAMYDSLSGRLARMEAAVRTLIKGLGEDVEREGLVDTPKVRANGCETIRVCCGNADMGPLCVLWPSLTGFEGTARRRLCSYPGEANRSTPPTRPQRVAKAFMDVTCGYSEDVKR